MMQSSSKGKDIIKSEKTKCSHAPKESCKTSDGCVWILDKGCRVKKNVPLAILASNNKKEAILVKVVGKVKRVSSKT